MENVHFLGNKDHRVLPEYMASMDVNIMCYRISDDIWTIGIYPLKLHEYLAVGKPIVSARLPSVEEFSCLIDIADNDVEWEEKIDLALRGRGVGSVDLRREIAAKNNWSNRVDRILRNLDRMAESI
ncbi:MAG: glycosyltransferase [Gammaproteobacteria bacterium]